MESKEPLSPFYSKVWKEETNRVVKARVPISIILDYARLVEEQRKEE